MTKLDCFVRSQRRTKMTNENERRFWIASYLAKTDDDEIKDERRFWIASQARKDDG